MPRKEDYIYLAGIIDGEGCISLCRMPRSNGNYYGRILIVNTDERLLVWLKDTFGGDYSFRKHKNHENWKPMGTWRISHGKAYDLLWNIEKYLKLKREQAIAVITLREAKKVARELHENYSFWKEGFQYIKDFITKCNKKGYAVT